MSVPTPSAIVRHLDQYVIGQQEAKKTLAVAVYAHYRRIGRQRADSGPGLAKSNVLIIGSTGTGKTLLCETLARALQLPFVTADATSLAQTEFINAEIDAILQRLLEKAAGDLARAQCGIVFIDEVDKLKAAGQQGGSSGERVQHALLKIMEGAPVRLADGRFLDTSHILFICGGAFVGLRNILAKSQAFGFISTGGGEDERILERLNARVKPTHLFEFGLIPEFAGRLPIVATFEDLDHDKLVRIMTEPRNALYRQFRELLEAEGVELEIEPAVFSQIAELAIEYQVGARSLRGIFEEMLTPVLYRVPDEPSIRKVVFTSLFAAPRHLDATGQPLPAT